MGVLFMKIKGGNLRRHLFLQRGTRVFGWVREGSGETPPQPRHGAETRELGGRGGTPLKGTIRPSAASANTLRKRVGTIVSPPGATTGRNFRFRDTATLPAQGRTEEENGEKKNQKGAAGHVDSLGKGA